MINFKLLGTSKNTTLEKNPGVIIPNRVISRSLILLMLLSLGFYEPTDLAAQDQNLQGQAATYQDRTLLVVIPTLRKKISALESRAGDSKKSKRQSELLERTRYEQARWQKEIMRAVQDHYTFSSFAFVLDSVLSRGLQVIPAFDGQLNATQVSRGAAWFMVRGHLESGAEALILQDENQQPLIRPFPYYRKLNGISTLFESFFSTKKPRWKSLDQVVGKMNERLVQLLPPQ